MTSIGALSMPRQRSRDASKGGGRLLMSVPTLSTETARRAGPGRAAWLVGALLALGPVVAAGDDTTASAASAVQSAAERGVAWLVEHQELVGAERSFLNLHKLYRAVADDALARRLLSQLHAREAEREAVDVDLDLSSPDYLDWKHLAPAIKRLVRQRCRGAVDAEALRRLSEHVAAHGEEILAPLRLTHRMVAAFHLAELGIDCCGFYERTQADLRALLARKPPERLATDIYALYALTHVLFTRSGYFDRYLDRQEFEPEAAALLAVLPHMLQGDPDDLEIDITGELLMSLRLLRVPPDATVRAAAGRLAALQNADGSWGRRHPIGRDHLTLTATLGLIELAEDFRGDGNIRCLPSEQLVTP